MWNLTDVIFVGSLIEWWRSIDKIELHGYENEQIKEP